MGEICLPRLVHVITASGLLDELLQVKVTVCPALAAVVPVMTALSGGLK